MLIRVTQEDIYAGSRMHGTRCPVALALRRTTGRDLLSGFWEIYERGNRLCKLPLRAQRFIHKFDSGKLVEPFAFKFNA